MLFCNPTARRWRARALAGAATLAMAAGGITAAVAVPASPAFASLPGLTSMAMPSSYDSDPSKTAVATCPNGTNVVGMGANVFGGSQDVSVEQIMPDLTTRTVTATAKESDPNGPIWEVWAWALCAPAPAGLVMRSVPSASTSDDKSVTDECPINTTLLSIGFDVGNGFGEVLVTQARPDGGAGIAATSATISAYEDDNYAANWTLVAYVLCASPIAGQQVVTAATTPASATTASPIAAVCPAGQNALGGSVEVEPTSPGAAGEFSISQMVPTTLPGGTVTDRVQVVVNEEDPVAYTWSERAFALCV